MSKPDKQQVEKLTRRIDNCVSAYRRLDSACRNAEMAGCLDPNGPLFNAIWRAFDTLLTESSVDSEWVHWHIYDNDCGKKGFEAGPIGKLRKVRNSRDLALVILESA